MKPENTLRESQRIAELAAEYERKGYAIALPRNLNESPAFLRELGYTPDLIATNGDETLVVEVKSRETSATLSALSSIAEQVNAKPGWHFVLVFTNPRSGWFELSGSSNGQYSFVLKAGNGEVILASELYRAKSSAENGIASVQVNCALDTRYERKTSTNGRAFFNLRAANGQVIGTSQLYASASAREIGIASVKSNGTTRVVKGNA